MSSPVHLRPVHLRSRFRPAAHVDPRSVCFTALLTTALALTFGGSALGFRSAGTTLPDAKSPASRLSLAEQTLAQGQADKALALLAPYVGDTSSSLPPDAAPATGGADADLQARAANLACRVHLEEQQGEQAATLCLRAVTLEPGNGSYHLWLGRTYGVQAQHASMFTAYGLARKVHDEFETAARLDAASATAQFDLGLYYVAAPRIVGGGKSKAADVVSRLATLAPILSHTLAARVAKADNDSSREEAELHAATAEANKVHADAGHFAPGNTPDEAAGAWVELAAFYGRHDRVPEMLAAIQSAAAPERGDGQALVSAASVLSRHGQNPALAEALLRRYLASNNLSEDAPAFRVHVQLARLMQASGRTAEARAELGQVHALAQGYQVKMPDMQMTGADGSDRK